MYEFPEMILISQDQDNNDDTSNQLIAQTNLTRVE